MNFKTEFSIEPKLENAIDSNFGSNKFSILNVNIYRQIQNNASLETKRSLSILFDRNKFKIFDQTELKKSILLKPKSERIYIKQNFISERKK